MTRINAGIPVKELNNKHLLAEHREIKRIPNCVAKGKYNMNGQLKKFSLGTGHVKFFYDKLSYLLNRYEDIYAECKERGFNVSYYGDAWKNIPINMMNDYAPTQECIDEVRNRIKQRMEYNSVSAL